MVRDLTLGAWHVHLEGPASRTGPLGAVLASMAVHGDAPAPLEIVVSADGRGASGIVADRVLWSLPLPQAGWLGVLVGQTVATLTGLLTRLLFVHGAAVAFGDGGYVFIGDSGTGKTSLAVTCLGRGARYVADDLVLVDPDTQTIIPVALPLSVKPWTARAVGPLPSGHDVACEGETRFWLPAHTAVGPVRPCRFVFLEGRADPSRLRPYSRAQGLLAIARQVSSFSYRHRAADALAGFARSLRGASCVAVDARAPGAVVDDLMRAAAP